MNLKNLLISSLAGFAAFFLLGWLFYGQLFPELHPESPETNMSFIALGCLFNGVMLAYIFQNWANMSNWMDGFKVGAAISLIGAFSMLFFMYSNMPMNSANFFKELIASTLSGGLTGAVIAFVNGKLNTTT